MGHVRTALRRLNRRRLRTYAAIATLACAIAVSTVSWSVVSATLLAPFDVRSLDRWFVVFALGEGGLKQREFVHSALPLIENVSAFDRVIAAWVPLESVVAKIGGVGRRVRLGFVTGDYFSGLDLGVQAGRSFDLRDDRRGVAPAAILTDRFWRQSFEASYSAIGRVVQVGASQATIVGVAPAGFRGLDLADVPDLYLPLSVISDVVGHETNYFAEPTHRSAPTAGLRMLVRLREGQSAAQAEAQLRTVGRSLPHLGAASVGLEPLSAAALKETTRGAMLMFSRMLATTVVLMLILGWAAVGLSLLITVERRRREFATCLALGARVSSLLFGIGLEAAMIAAMAALLALPVAHGLLVGLRGYILPGAVALETLELGLDGRAVAACAMSGAVTLVALTSLTVAYAYTRLRSLTIAAVGTRGPGAVQYRSCNLLLAVQVSAALVLLSGAGLFVRSLQGAMSLNRSLAVDTVVTSEVDLAWQRYDTARAASFFEEWGRRMRATPAISEAAYCVDEGGMSPRGRLAVDGVPRAFPSTVRFRAVDGGYFRTIGLPILEGRGFEARDRVGMPLVGIASASLARLVARNGVGLGRTIGIPAGGGGPTVTTVIGVVPDVVVDVADLQPLVLYLPIAQRTVGTYRTLTLRPTGDDDTAARAAVSAARSIDPSIALPPLLTMRERIARQMAPQSLGAAVLGILGIVSLCLTLVGTYVLADAVTLTRTGEIGVRVALGATPGEVIGLLLVGVVRPLLIGLLTGVCIVWAGTSTLRALLFRVHPTDPSTLGGVVALLATVVVVASLGPAIAAARQSVAELLRLQ